MRKLSILLSASLLASVISMQAQWRTTDEALRIAWESKLSANDGRHQSPASNPRLAYTLRDSKSGQSLLYGVNYENGGFALVSGCEYTPAILGYADHGTLPSDIKEMPEGLSYMLGVYEQQLEYAASHMHKTAQTRTVSQNADIEPLLETKWNQGEPYNRYCPNNYPAGCVAVAMAQTMRYHQWPNQGTGSHNGYDFSQHTWNWNNMLPSYSSGNYSEEQADEVATLIRQLGASVDMEYAEGGSGAISISMLNSLQQYWKYDDGMSLAIRSNYSDSEWMQLLYNELNAGRPVPYAGRGEDSDTEYAYLAGLGEGSVHKTVTLTKAGTLAELLGDEADDITHLTIVGLINGTDLGTLRSLVGEEHSRLTHLDMKDASIVKGGEYRPDMTLDEDNLLPESVFDWSQSLQYVIVPNSLERIDRYAFLYSFALKEVVLNEGLKEISFMAFQASPLEVLHIPSTVEFIKPDFISKCDRLTDLSVDAANPYYVCDGNAIYTTDYKVLVVVNPAFSGEYTLNENCQEIGETPLIYNNHTTGLVAPSVKKVQYGGFFCADSLEYIAFGYPLKTLGYLVFAHCNSLKNIYLGCKEIPSGGYANANWENISECTLYVPASSIELYKADAFWGQMKEVLPIEDTRFAYLCEVLAQSIVFDESSFSMFKGETHPLVAHVLPENTSNKMVSWSSSDETVATVDQNGVVTAIKKGTAKITAIANDGSGVSNSVTVAVENVTATGIELNYSSYTLEKGETVQLSAAITPDNVEDHSVTWTSSNTDIATVSSNGLVTAKAVGSALISAKTNDGSNLSATCAVTVEKTMVSSITLSTTNVDLKVAETCQLTATVLPENATNKNVIWSSSNEGVATVTSSGLVNAIAIGDAVIKAAAEDGSGVSASAQISVKAVPVTSIALSETYVEIEVGGQYTLTAMVNPSNATNKDVVWSSDNENIAMVTSLGTVIALAPGQVKVAATAADGSGVSASATVKVNDILVNNITLNYTSYSLDMNDNVQLEATVEPENATNKNLVWTSSDEDVVLVSSSGKVLWRGIGMAVVTATSIDGSNVSASCTFSCINGISTITVDKDSSIRIYTVDGKEVGKLQKGVNIILKADGKSERVIVE